MWPKGEGWVCRASPRPAPSVINLQREIKMKSGQLKITLILVSNWGGWGHFFVRWQISTELDQVYYRGAFFV